MKTGLFILLFSMISLVLPAQNARAILDKASDAYNRAGAVTTKFTLTTKDTKTKTNYAYDGTAYMKGNKFKIEIPEAITWFDGTTQWVYVKDTEEVNVSTPTGEELQAISPSLLFNIYKKGFDLKYLGEKTSDGKAVYRVELTPQKKGTEFTKIVVDINKATNMFSQITVIDKVGLENTLTIKKYTTGSDLPDSTFQFRKSDYPNAEVVDLR